MKTYFMAWQSDNKRGHSVFDFDVNESGEEIKPRKALSEMINYVIKEFSESDIPLKGVVSATQFNRVT